MKSFVLVLLVTISIFRFDQLISQDKQEPLFTAELGIAPYTFRKSFPNGVAATLDTIKMLGFTEIEGGGADMDAKEYRKLCDQRGLSIPSMGASYKQIVDGTEEVIARAKTYGASFVMCAWIPHKTGHFSIEDAKKAVEDFNKAGGILAEHGITLCYHAHGYEFHPYRDGTLLDYMMDQTNPDFVSFEMDIFWIEFGGGDPVELLNKYGNRWKLMHLKDMKHGITKDLTGLTDPEHDVALGTGQIDIEAVLHAAKAAGIKHYFIEDESSRILSQIPKSIAYLKALKE